MRRRLARGWLALALAGALAACVSRPPDPCRRSYAGEAPLWSIRDRLVVPSMVNGHLTGLLLDTGGQVSIVSAHRAALLGLRPIVPPPGTHLPPLQGVGGSRTAHLMAADTLIFGNLAARGVRFVVPDDRPGGVFAADLSTLGMNFLGGYDLDLDVLGRRLVFYRTALCTAAHTALAPPYYSVPKVFDPREDRPVVMVGIGGQRFRAALDTGATQSILFHDGAERLGLSAQVLSTDRHVALGGIGADRVDAVRHALGPITIGGLTIHNLDVSVSGDTVPAVELVLGMDFLRKFHVWILNASREVILQYPARRSPGGAPDFL